MRSHLAVLRHCVYLLACVMVGMVSSRTVQPVGDCRQGYLVCRDELTCLEMTRWCDGVPDCPTGEDELESLCGDMLPLGSEEDDESFFHLSPRLKIKSKPTKRTVPVSPVECAKHEIMCNDSRKCISQQAFCDGTPDCPDEDDESSDCIPKSLTFYDVKNIMLPCFQRVIQSKNITRLHNYTETETSTLLSNCPDPDDPSCDHSHDIVEMEATPQCGKVEGLPPACRWSCYDDSLDVTCSRSDGKLVNLSKLRPSPHRLIFRYPHRNLPYIGPKSVNGPGVYLFLDKLHSMNFSDTGLAKISPRSFERHNLTILDLSANNLTGLGNQAFAGLKVCLLQLKSNRLLDWHPDAFQRRSPVMWLDARFNSLTLEEPGMLHNLVHTSVIELRNNSIRRITKETFRGLIELRNLDMAYNHIDVIEMGAFSDTKKLSTLVLSHNKISSLPEDLFLNNKDLRHLELANNPIQSFPANFFRNFNCTLLDLEGVVIENIDENMFRSLPPTCVVKFEKLYYCFTAPQIRNCTPKFDGISSFENLLVSPLLVSLAWILGVFTIVCNLAVFCARWYLDRALQNGIHEMVVRDARVMSLFVKHLSFSDLLTGVYLLGICYYNELWRGEYNRHAVEWVHSGTCKVLGIVAMSSAEISMMILTFIAVDRFVTIAFGLHKPKCSIAIVRVILVLLWLAGFTFAIVPALQWGDRIHDYYGNNGVCLPLYLQEPLLDGWIYSLVVLIGLNGFMILLIILSYGGIFYSIRRWRQTEKPAGSDERQERELLWRFFVLVFVNLCCWIPTFVFKILALTSYKVPDDSYAWIVTFVFPLNGAMNPIVYSLSSSEFRARVSYVTGCHRVYVVLLRRLHVLHRRLSAPFTTSNDLPVSGGDNGSDAPPEPASRAASGSPSLCSRLREKCLTVVTPRNSQDARLSVLSNRSSRRPTSDLRLDVPLPHEVIPLNKLDSDQINGD